MLKKKTWELSTGQRRLLEVILILFSPHPFCLLDEPFSGMAPLQIERLQGILGQTKFKKGIIITDHLHEQARSVADSMYVLSGGKTHLIENDDQLVDFGYLPSR